MSILKIIEAATKRQLDGDETAGGSPNIPDGCTKIGVADDNLRRIILVQLEQVGRSKDEDLSDHERTLADLYAQALQAVVGSMLAETFGKEGKNVMGTCAVTSNWEIFNIPEQDLFALHIKEILNEIQNCNECAKTSCRAHPSRHN